MKPLTQARKGLAFFAFIAFIVERAEMVVCLAALAVMALLPALDALLRPFNIVIPFSRFLLIRLFLVAALFAAMLTTRKKEHIIITLIQFAKNERIKDTFALVTGLISAFIATLLFWDSLSFIRFSLSGRVTGFLPDSFFAFAMPIAYAVIAIRFAAYAVGPPAASEAGAPAAARPPALVLLAPLVIIAGSAAALPAIAKLLWGFEPPPFFYDLVNRIYDITALARTPLIIFLVIAALSGTPVFAVIGGIALVMLQASGCEPEAAPLQIYASLTDSDIIAIPLFTLTGFFLSESRAGERLVTTFRALFSWLPGGMVIATVLICAFFTSFTGASGVTILALGGILYTILKDKLGYPDTFTVGLLTSVGCVGLLFPPSLPIILVGSTMNSILYFMEETVSHTIIDFFIGALIPGILMVLVRIAFGLVVSRKVRIPVEPFNIKRAASSVKGSAFEILLPIILIGGYFSGILSLVEVSAVSVIYIFIVEVIIHRDIKLRDIPTVVMRAAPIIGGILVILSMAKALSYAIIDSQMPEALALWMRSTVQSKLVFLLLLNLALLVVGCLMDIFSAILVVFPLLVPLGLVYGIDPVHLGVIFIVNLELGFITPPVGMNLFLASYRFKRPFIEVTRSVLPFMAAQLAVVFLVTYVPSLSTALVALFK